MAHVPQQALQAALTWKTEATQPWGLSGARGDTHRATGRLGASGWHGTPRDPSLWLSWHCTVVPPMSQQGGAQTHHQKLGGTLDLDLLRGF